MGNDAHGEHMDGSPVGARLAAWRRRRGLGVGELARLIRGRPERILALEGGEEWVDQRGELAVLAKALRLDTAALTGQPYEPSDDRHALVRSVAFQVRRILAGPEAAGAAGSVEELAVLTSAAVAASEDGDEFALARQVPDLIRIGDGATASASPGGRKHAATLRMRGHATAAGLLRRLGFWDLAWTLLHRARSGMPDSDLLLGEQAHLLIDMGHPDHALARVERAAQAAGGYLLPTLAALAKAITGDRRSADRILREATARADNPLEQATVTVAHAEVCVESGAYDEAVELTRSLNLDRLPTALRFAVLTTTAAARTRLGAPGEAATCLAEAEAAAPLRARLDPRARELMAVLPSRIGDAATAELIQRMAARADVR